MTAVNVGGRDIAFEQLQMDTLKRYEEYSACPMRTLGIRMTGNRDSRGQQANRGLPGNGRYNDVCVRVCNQSISLYLPAEIIDDIVSQMSISMLKCFNVTPLKMFNKHVRMWLRIPMFSNNIIRYV